MIRERAALRSGLSSIQEVDRSAAGPGEEEVQRPTGVTAIGVARTPFPSGGGLAFTAGGQAPPVTQMGGNG